MGDKGCQYTYNARVYTLGVGLVVRLWDLYKVKRHKVKVEAKSLRAFETCATQLVGFPNVGS